MRGRKKPRGRFVRNKRLSGLEGVRSAAWRFLLKSRMGTIFVVGNVLAEQAFQVAFVDGDDVI